MMFSVDINKVDTFGFACHDTTGLSFPVAGGYRNIALQSFHEKTSPFPMNRHNILAPLLGKRFVVVEEEREWSIIFHGGVIFCVFVFWCIWFCLERKIPFGKWICEYLYRLRSW
jgi:hypothetical protein